MSLIIDDISSLTVKSVNSLVSKLKSILTSEKSLIVFKIKGFEYRIERHKNKLRNHVLFGAKIDDRHDIEKYDIPYVIINMSNILLVIWKQIQNILRIVGIENSIIKDIDKIVKKCLD